MTHLLRAARLALPVLFFGYGMGANLSMLQAPPTHALPETGLLSGGLTRGFDGAYRQDLAHMDLSSGLIGAARYALLGEARTGALVGRDGWLFTAEETRPVPDAAGLAAIAGTVQGIRDRLRAAGVDLVVVPLPAKIDIDRDRSPDPAFGQALAALLDRFSRHLADRGVAVVDARAALLAPDGAVPRFFATDTHWTPDGAQRVAAAVAASGHLARGGLRFDRVAGDARPLTGDLIRFVTTDDLAPRLGLLPEMLTPIVQTPRDGAADIFGAGPADIVLVGTSYSANPDWGFADALMVALGRDVVSMAEPGKGPLRPMLDYLDSAAFRDAPPAAVIWEIPIRHLTDAAIWPQPGARAGPDIAFLTPQKETPDG
jgi:alginate O-acetyltransferase complex protein AlgJ